MYFVWYCRGPVCFQIPYAGDEEFAASSKFDDSVIVPPALYECRNSRPFMPAKGPVLKAIFDRHAPTSAGCRAASSFAREIAGLLHAEIMSDSEAISINRF